MSNPTPAALRETPRCWRCNGAGEYRVARFDFARFPSGYEVKPCRTCDGTGENRPIITTASKVHNATV